MTPETLSLQLGDQNFHHSETHWIYIKHSLHDIWVSVIRNVDCPLKFSRNIWSRACVCDQQVMEVINRADPIFDTVYMRPLQFIH